MEEKQLSKFIKYLINIGLLSTLTKDDFISYYNSIKNQSTSNANGDLLLKKNYFQDKITKSIVIYINSLTEEKKRQLSVDIFSKYNEITTNAFIVKVKKIINIQSLHIKEKYFHIWKRKFCNVLFHSLNKKHQIGQNFNLNTSSPTILSNNTIINSTRDIKINKKSNITPATAYQSIKQKEKIIEGSRELKEIEELSHCTFHPNINDTLLYYNHKVLNNTNNKNLSIISNGNGNVHDRLYTEHKRMIERRNIKVMENENDFAKVATFKPELISSSPKMLKIKYNFNERIKSFYDKKNKSIEKIKSEIELDFDNNYSFSPNISASQKTKKAYYKSNIKIKEHKLHESLSSDRLPVYERLYKQNVIKKQNLLTKLKEINKEIKLTASSSTRNIRENNGVISERRGVDYKKIEELYNSYKKEKNKIEQKRNEVDIEQGITFKPEFFTNEKYYNKINQNFFEREKKFVEEKNNYINSCNQLMDDFITKNTLGYGKYSNKEKQEIANNIIQRLYVKGMERKGGINQRPRIENENVQINNRDIVSDGNNK